MSTISVEVLKYNNVLSLNRMSFYSLTSLRHTVENIIHDVVRRINIRPLKVLQVIPGLLEQYNIRYTEKWIKAIDENFLEYNIGIRPRLNIPFNRPLPRNLRYLSDKFFSGDISGTIAESLFIYLLDELGIDISLVGHLRPIKRKNMFLPDFIIWDNRPEIRQLISSSTYQPPLYAEVKGSTSGINHEKLIKALFQLNKLLNKQSNCGVVFLAFRDYQNLNYKALVLEVVRY